MNLLCNVDNIDLPSLSGQLNWVKNPYGRRMTESMLLEMIEKYNPIGIIAGLEPMTRNVLKQAKNLRVVSRFGAGLDSVDLDAAKEFGIKIFNTPTAPVEAVAEFTVGMMLTLMRHIHTQNQKMAFKKWEKTVGTLLNGKTVGLVGCGQIGGRVAEILSAFHCNVLGFTRSLKNHPHCQMVSLENLLKVSDIVSLHVALTEQTHHIINADSFRLMKKTALLINTSRGPVIDEDALLKALNNDEIAGAALDVFEQEPYSGPLCELGDKVLLSPHAASSTFETREEMAKGAIANLFKGLAREDISVNE